MRFGAHGNSGLISPPGPQIGTRVAMVVAALVVMLGFSAVGIAGQDGGPQNSTKLVRIGISQSTWGGLNRNDAMAALKAWAKTILEQRKMMVDVEATLFNSPVDVAGSLRDGRIDAISMPTYEFLGLDPGIKPETVFLAIKDKSYTERYVFLVHRSSGISDISGLRGHQVVLHKNPQTVLVPRWLDTLLASHSADLAQEVSRNAIGVENASKAVLQVFFRKADACVVTSKVFDMVSELNPQVKKELRVLASSPDVVPTVFCFRVGYASEIRELLEDAMLTLHESPAGKQVLTVFQCDSLVRRPISALEGTLRMLTEYERMMQRQSSGEGQGPLTRVAQ